MLLLPLLLLLLLLLLLQQHDAWLGDFCSETLNPEP